MDTDEAVQQQHQSPFLGMFEGFRSELDEHHDRRERVIKASRDITAASKKMDIVQTQLKSVTPDLQGMNFWRYHQQISPGFQEYLEAATFQHYLETQTLLQHGKAVEQLNGMIKDGDDNVGRLGLPLEDYVLAAYDMTGELMRFAITSMATSGSLPGLSEPLQPTLDQDKAKQRDGESRKRSVLEDLQELGSHLQGLDLGDDFTFFKKNVGGKASVTQGSIEKVEKALYGLVVRGSERPKGWMPDLKEESRGGEIEGY
ncbi:MAG: hypothetical protein M1831_005497 [Alyxoria varia]|nr:MAG: hypothetical protein M1831_005497 [Alyxoria varia]